MESIEDFELKSKPSAVTGKPTSTLLESPWFIVILCLLIGISAFALGRVSAFWDQREPVRVMQTDTNRKPQDASSQSATVIQVEQKAEIPTSQQVTGSKNGTKYHLPTCPGAKQISEKNKITFASIDEARARGYTPASNCKGLK